MTERPILFSAPMVRAILDGTKTQTRRVAKPRGRNSLFDVEADGSPMWTDSYILDPGNREWLMRDNRYGQPGDRLWVRETWGMNHYQFEHGPIPKARPADFDEPDSTYLVHRATEDDAEVLHELRWWPSIHMPRWASRVLLEITDVRVERLKDINEADAQAEGAAPCANGWWFDASPQLAGSDARGAYYCLWEQINGAGSWDANPLVWVLTFERVQV